MGSPQNKEPLTAETYAQGLAELAAQDPDLASVTAAWGPPPFWVREPGFGTLVQIILEQQVSLASASAAYGRLVALLGSVTPEGLLGLNDQQLRQVGFSRQKAGYCRGLAQALLGGALNLEALAAQEDADTLAALMQVKGIGRWSAQVYVLMALRRPDCWPSGDLALAAGFQKLKGLNARPTYAELDTYATRWQPWRGVAARALWHYYLSGERSTRSLQP